MKLTWNKIIKAKLALSGLKNEELAQHIDVDKSSLSRNESQNFYDKVYQFFEKYDSEINEAFDLILDYFSIEDNDLQLKSDKVEEPKYIKYNNSKSFSKLLKENNDLKRDKFYLQKSLDALDREISQCHKTIDELESELDKLNSDKKNAC